MSDPQEPNDVPFETPEPLELRTIEEAAEQGDLEALPPPPYLYTKEDVLDLVQSTLRFHRGKTGWEVPCLYDDRKFLSERIQEVIAEAARPAPEFILNKWHDAWLAIQLRDGWSYAEEFDGESLAGQFDYRASPLIIPFLFTPPEYQTMGHLFWNTVRGLQHVWDRT